VLISKIQKYKKIKKNKRKIKNQLQRSLKQGIWLLLDSHGFSTSWEVLGIV
jgi:hypothetical protein